jgi:hypothetical protein
MKSKISESKYLKIQRERERTETCSSVQRGKEEGKKTTPVCVSSLQRRFFFFFFFLFSFFFFSFKG